MRDSAVRCSKSLVALALLAFVPACRTMMRPPPRTAPPPPPPSETVEEGTPTEPSPHVTAIIDSIRAVVRDSIEGAARDSISAAATRDSIAAAARRDSIEAAARESIAAAARRDSIAAAARRDSIEAAARDLIVAAARRDSIAAAARRDSIEAALQDSIVAVARRDSIEAARAAAPVSEDLEQLRALGPAYIPYDEGPTAILDTEMQADVTTTLLPIVRAEELPARTRAYFWLLVRADGTVDQAVLQTSSGSDAFDVKAEEIARRLVFRPAIRTGRAVPTWVVRDISLVM